METITKEYQKAIDYIYELIEQGELCIGDKLPTERFIAEQLNMSRNSTREALRTLENMGVIESRQGSGNYLVGHVSKTITKAIDMMLLLRQTNIKEISSFRRSMEISVCQAIIDQGLSEKWKRQLEEIITKMDSISCSSDLSEQVELDRQFHFTLIYATENQFWICIAESVIEVYRRFIDAALQNANSTIRQTLSTCHKDLFHAIQKGDRQACEQAINRHYHLVETQK